MIALEPFRSAALGRAASETNAGSGFRSRPAVKNEHENPVDGGRAKSGISCINGENAPRQEAGVHGGGHVH